MLFFLRGVFLASLLSAAGASQAMNAQEPVNALEPPTHGLGASMRILVETDALMDWRAAREALVQARPSPDAPPVHRFGIGHAPVWAYMVIDNPAGHALQRLLTINPTWTDEIDVHVIGPTGIRTSWHTGDARPGALYLDDALGYLLKHDFQPGRSEVLIRIATLDPMMLNVTLLTPEDQDRKARFERYSYGVLYGFVSALAVLNLLMYFGLGRSNSLYYALYLLSFVIVSLSYTGRGLVWLWPETPYVQRYVILFFMTAAACVGLKFAREFLELDTQTPALGKALRWTCHAVMAWITLAVALDLHRSAVYTAFLMSMFFALVLVPLGVHAARRRQPAAGYFLVAGVVSAIGLMSTTLSVWGLLPFPYNSWTYRGVEMSTMVEALLLQLALVDYIRSQIHQRLDAERDARMDALTQLANRRGFLEQAEVCRSVALRHQRPMTLVILDVDYFKSINDTHGHAVGDEVLVKLSRILLQLTRNGDCVARWGGEEFILLLPETDLAAGSQFAERVRNALEEMTFTAPQGAPVRITASFGVAQLEPGQSLEKLIIVADDALYSVKASGRNRVACAS